MKPIYFDNTATTPVDPAVVQTVTTALSDLFGNPSSLHAFGRRSRAALEEARASIAKTYGCQPDEIVFTSGGTGANNLVLRAAVKGMGIRHIITSRLEHKAVLRTVEDLGLDRCSYVKTDAWGCIDLDDLERLLGLFKGQTLVSLMHGNNEIGNLNDLHEIGSRAAAQEALFHSDMVQTLGKYPISLDDLPVDFASFSAHKIYGPKGVGFAYIKRGHELPPLFTGGGQEQDRRSGTEATSSILGMAKAVSLMAERREADAEHISDLKSYCLDRLREAIPQLAFNGQSDTPKGLYNLISIRLPGSYPLIHFNLDLNGIAVSAGSACASGAAKLSHVIQALGVCDTTIRLSFNRYNTPHEVDCFVECLTELLKPETAEPQVSKPHLAEHQKGSHAPF